MNHAAPSPARGLTARALALLAAPAAPAAIIAVALLLSSGVLWLSVASDDHLLSLALDPQAGIRGLRRAPWDLFSFAKDADSVRALMEEGVFPWWSDPAVRINFFRPLSSLTHWLDQVLLARGPARVDVLLARGPARVDQLWPGRAALMHLHSWLWFAALLGVVNAIYRRLCGSASLAALALALFAWDDARAYTIGWICNRNGLIALAFGFAALLAHDRARRAGSRAARWLAPLWLALGLLSGETALQVCAYLFAYALFIDQGSRRARAVSLAPYALVVVAWRVLYTALGYGAFGSGLYIDPGRDPGAFAQAVVERLPVLLAAQYAGVISELTDGLPVIAPRIAPLFAPLCALCVALVLALLWPLLRRDRMLRFWLTGSLLASLPVCGVSPSDRVLTATALGGAAALASLLVALLEGMQPLARWRLLGGAALGVVNLVIAPLLLPLRIQGVDRVEDVLERADGSISSAPEMARKTLILINPPLDPFAVFFPLYRASHRVQRPGRFRWLTTGVSELSLERVDARTLRVTPRAGFMSNSSQWMLRDPRRRMHAGQTVALEGVHFEVESLNARGLPARVLVRFEVPLEDPSLDWMRWDTHGYLPFTPPAPGRRVQLPAVDMVRALF
jgi:hypothetical protein